MNSNYKITAADLKHRKQDSVLLDVRDEMSFQYGHINDAINIPLEQLKEQLQQSREFKQFDQTKQIIVYCKKGEASAEAVALLREAGMDAYDRVGG